MGSKFVFAICVLATVSRAMVYAIEDHSNIVKYSYGQVVPIPPTVGFRVFETEYAKRGGREVEYKCLKCAMSECFLGNEYCPGLIHPTMMQISTEICQTKGGKLGKRHCCYASP